MTDNLIKYSNSIEFAMQCSFLKLSYKGEKG